MEFCLAHNKWIADCKLLNFCLLLEPEADCQGRLGKHWHPSTMWINLILKRDKIVEPPLKISLCVPSAPSSIYTAVTLLAAFSQSGTGERLSFEQTLMRYYIGCRIVYEFTTVLGSRDINEDYFQTCF